MTSPAPIALVTGASRGIGLAIATALAKNGYRTALTARDGMRLEAAARDLELGGATAVAIPGDLRDPGAPARIVAMVRERLGGMPHVLVNNAGTAPTAKVENTTDAMLDEVIAMHVRAPLAFVRECLPAMKQAGGGVLLQLGSTAGMRGYAFTSAYTAAKHGMLGLTRAIAAELASTAIRCYALCPGFVDTDITRSAAAAVSASGRSTAEQVLARMASQNRIGRLHTTAEVAKAALHLVTQLPKGVVYDLDRTEPGFVEDA